MVVTHGVMSITFDEWTSSHFNDAFQTGVSSSSLAMYPQSVEMFSIILVLSLILKDHFLHSFINLVYDFIPVSITTIITSIEGSYNFSECR